MKKVLYTLLAVLLLSTLTLTVVTPVMACVPNTDIDISASSTELSAPDNIVLTISEANTGLTFDTDLYNVCVWLYENSESNLIATLDATSPNFSGDPKNFGVLDDPETWSWNYEVTVTESTKFIVIGYGELIDGTPVTYPEFQDERAEIDITVTNGGGEGFTPGYWRNHYEDWAGYSPGDDFDTTFGVNWYDPDITMEDAIWINGGGLKALTRHAAAALLNAAHPGVDYDMTEAEVIAAVQAVDPDNKTETTALKDTFAALNELEGDLIP